jgi:hypothetical protein
MSNPEKTRAAYARIVARAWREPAFKSELIADPGVVLEAAGFSIPAGVKVKVVENTATHVHLVLPPKPTEQLSDEALDGVAAGWGGGSGVVACALSIVVRKKS